MRGALLAVAVLAACAAPRAAPVEPEPVAAVAPAAMLYPPPPCPLAAALAERLRGFRLESLTAGWSRRNELPKPEACYGVAAVTGVSVMCDGWSFEVLVDHESPRVV